MDSSVASGHQALAHLDALLAKAPEADSALFSACTKCLADLRDHLIAEQRASPPYDLARKNLAHVNAVISVVMAGHFPLGPIPWSEVRKARLWLAEIVGDQEKGLLF